jgi:hypothetical protein
MACSRFAYCADAPKDCRAWACRIVATWLMRLMLLPSAGSGVTPCVATELRRDPDDVRAAFKNLRLMAHALYYPLTALIMLAVCP